MHKEAKKEKSRVLKKLATRKKRQDLSIKEKKYQELVQYKKEALKNNFFFP